MKLFILFAFIFAHAMCQGIQEFNRHEVKTTDVQSKSMLGMLSRFIEINGTIDQVMMKGSTTESAFVLSRMWLNATERPSGICEIEEEHTEEVIVTERIPYQVEVEVWCWSIRCTEWETHYREEQHKKNVTQTRLVSSLNDNASQF